MSNTADAVYADDADDFCAIAPLAANWSPTGAPPVKKLAATNHSATFYITNSSGVILETRSATRCATGRRQSS